MSIGHVAVVGGGFSGTLQAIQLLRHGLQRVTLIERARRPGRGTAYRTIHPDHLLNVRAGSMSAFPAAPSHFADWHAERGGDAADFAERRQYGAYVEELLDAARAEAGDRLQILHGDVSSIERSGDGEVIVLSGGPAITADVAILAIGNLPPADPSWLESAGLADGIYVADPWASDLAAKLRPEDALLLIGTGLTAVDAALMLEAARFEGRILALSRRGLLPRAHAEPSPVPRLEDEPQPTGVSLLCSVRQASERIGWRAAVDQLRPVTQKLWSSAKVPERRRFLRHLRPWWDVHRHRIAPAIADRIGRMEEGGWLEVRAGKIQSVEAEEDRALVRWRARGSLETSEIRASRIVNCTGPEHDIRRAGEPLLDQLLHAGRIRPDPCRIGIDVDQKCSSIGSNGAPSATLCAIGPMTRGTFWEIVAVPDIRVQVAALAARLTA